MFKHSVVVVREKFAIVGGGIWKKKWRPLLRIANCAFFLSVALLRHLRLHHSHPQLPDGGRTRRMFILPREEALA